MNVLQNSFPSKFNTIESVQGKYFQKSTDINSGGSSSGINSFGNILNNKVNGANSIKESNEVQLVKFSKHATSRLEQRNIELSDEQLERLNAGAQKAFGKGINESLIMVDQLAFIVNIPNSTVITAMDQTEAEENVFTNIDGAVII